MDPDPLGNLSSAEDLDVVDTPASVLLDFLAQPSCLRGITRDLQVAALDDVGVDAFAGGDGDHLVDGLVQHPLPGDDAVAAVPLGQLSAMSRRKPGQPAAVAAGGAEPGEPGLQHRDGQARVELLEVVGRPQAGVTGADDAHVGLPVPGQRRARIGQAREPVRDSAIDGHVGNRTQALANPRVPLPSDARAG